MTLAVAVGFVTACVLLAVTPGPNMALIISSTLGGGLRAGLVTLAGTLSGLAILVTVAAVGMTSIMVLMSEWFDVIRWLGAVYLIVLGVRQLRQFCRSRRLAASASAPEAGSGAVTHDDHSPLSTSWRFVQGIVVALSNPKVLLFLGAFFPQFVSPAAPPGPQLAILSVVFLLTLATVDVCYTLAIAKARKTVDISRLRLLDAVSGALLLAGGLVLATARRP